MHTIPGPYNCNCVVYTKQTRKTIKIKPPHTHTHTYYAGECTLERARHLAGINVVIVSQPLDDVIPVLTHPGDVGVDGGQ